MYATKMITQIYHLVPANGNKPSNGDHTLCGLRISRLPSGVKLAAGNLQRVEHIPPSKTVCKHCERIKNQTD